MSWNEPLLWMSAITTLAMVARTARARPLRSWLIVSLIILFITAVAYATVPDVAGYIAAAAWMPLLLLPIVIMRLIMRALQVPAFTTARWLARLLTLLHPSQAQRAQVHQLRVAELASRGELAEAAALIAGMRELTPRAALIHEADMLRYACKWDELAALLAGRLTRGDILGDPTLLLLWARALAETGRREEMLILFAAEHERLAKPAMVAIRDTARLYTFAFSGETAALARLLSQRLHGYGHALKRLWSATAGLVAGDEGDARRELEELTRSRQWFIAEAARARLARALVLPRTPLSQRERVLVARTAAEMDAESRYLPVGGPRPIVTYALVAANLVVYGIELVSGGGTDPRVLFDLGELSAYGVLVQGEWWRLVAFAFLHAGSAHLLLNMMALWVLGPFAERALGRGRFFVVYLLAAVGGGAGILALQAARVIEANPVVGASGGIMGVVGMTAAVLLRGAVIERARIAKRRLVSIVAVLGFQTVFDLVTPEVSFLGHAFGVILGFAAALLLLALRRQPRPRSSEAAAGSVSPGTLPDTASSPK